MTPKEIENVRAAWEADPECRPSIDGLTLEQITIDTPTGPWTHWGWRSAPDSQVYPLEGFPEIAIRDALHRWLLERGARVAKQAQGGYAVIQDDSIFLPVDPSLISAMALGVVALAKGEPHAQA